MSTATAAVQATTTVYLIEGPAAGTKIAVPLDGAGMPPAVIQERFTDYARDRRRELGPAGSMWVYVLRR